MKASVMATIRFARLIFEKKLSHYNDSMEAVKRRKENLLDVIDFDTNVNSLLKSSENSYYVDRGDWGYGDVGDEENLIWGNIGKRNDETKTIRDEQVEGYVNQDQEDNDVAFFLIDVEKSVIAYEYRRNVGKKAPVRILESIFNVFHQNEEKLRSSTLVDKHDVEVEMQELERITSFSFVNLHPTNPDSTNHSKDMDEFLSNGGIDNMTIEAEGEDGIRLEETPLLNSGLGLAEEGYGKARVSGIRSDGGEKEIRTDGLPITVDMDEELSEEQKKRMLMQEIHSSLDRINE
jgi:hypothetical protein